MKKCDSTSLTQTANEIRKKFIQMHFNAHAGHIGGGLSCIDILTYLYSTELESQDKFILSKGHAASSLYATLNHFKLLSDEDFSTYYQDGTLLAAHPSPLAFPSIIVATGSLGHGFPIASGIAYANQYLVSNSAKVTCLISDGECNEGTTWEAALFASHHRLNQLTVVIDANGLQGFGRTQDILHLEPLVSKWQAFGFQVQEIDGHDFNQIHNAFQIPSSDKPRCIIARTVKGKGVSFMENKMEWHYLPMEQVQFAQAAKDLDSL